MPIAPVTSRRLLIREFRSSDWRAVHAYASDPETVRYMDWGPNTESDTRAFIRRVVAAQTAKQRGRYDLAVTLRKNGELIGSCAVVVNRARREGDIGYCLNRSYWRKGYGTEVARAMVSFGFATLALHRVTGRCDPANIASSRVLANAGMTLEGRLREDFPVRGKWCDTMIYGILDHEWGRRRAGRRRGRPAVPGGPMDPSAEERGVRR